MASRCGSRPSTPMRHRPPCLEVFTSDPDVMTALWPCEHVVLEHLVRRHDARMGWASSSSKASLPPPAPPALIDAIMFVDIVMSRDFAVDDSDKTDTLPPRPQLARSRWALAGPRRMGERRSSNNIPEQMVSGFTTCPWPPMTSTGRTRHRRRKRSIARPWPRTHARPEGDHAAVRQRNPHGGRPTRILYTRGGHGHPGESAPMTATRHHPAGQIGPGQHPATPPARDTQSPS